MVKTTYLSAVILGYVALAQCAPVINDGQGSSLEIPSVDPQNLPLIPADGSTPSSNTQPPTPGSNTQPSTPGSNTQPSTPGSNTQPSTPGSNTQPSTPGNTDTQPSTPGNTDTQPPTTGSNTQPSTPGNTNTQPSTPGNTDTQPPTPGSTDTQPIAIPPSPEVAFESCINNVITTVSYDTWDKGIQGCIATLQNTSDTPPNPNAVLDTPPNSNAMPNAPPNPNTMPNSGVITGSN